MWLSRGLALSILSIWGLVRPPSCERGFSESVGVRTQFLKGDAKATSTTVSPQHRPQSLRCPGPPPVKARLSESIVRGFMGCGKDRTRPALTSRPVVVDRPQPILEMEGPRRAKHSP